MRYFSLTPSLSRLRERGLSVRLLSMVFTQRFWNGVILSDLAPALNGSLSRMRERVRVRAT
ncbi:hypothetical protein E05_33740 [Plautia stali symbiont]|nr:hypothetical protein E05_33740 [Plautia stali symbiont]